MIWHALATYELKGSLLPTLVLGNTSFELALPSPAPQKAIEDLISGRVSAFAEWQTIAAELAQIADAAHAGNLKLKPVSKEARLVQPFTPSRIFAAASNFIEHASEMGTVLAAKADSAPYVFMKASTCVIGPDAPIILPPSSQQVDWEVELAAVIGTGGRNIAPERALDHVAAYSIMNDISARDLTRRSDYPFKFDWFRGKSFDTFGPFGPWLVPASLIEDPQKLTMQLHVNGVTMQNDNTASMIFSLVEQIAYLSSILTLQPGDVIATGTPSGVGMGSGTYLKAGDVVVASIERIGSLRNPVTRA